MILRVDPRAQLEIDNAVGYYGSQRTGLGREFAEEISRGYDSIEANPRAWSPFGKTLRKHKLNRFPYSIVYTEIGNDVRIVAVAHHSRGPGYWRSVMRQP